MSSTEETNKRQHRGSISLRSVDVSNLRAQFMKKEEEAKKQLVPKFQKKESKFDVNKPSPKPCIITLTSPTPSRTENDESPIVKEPTPIQTPAPFHTAKQQELQGPAISFQELRNKFLKIEQQAKVETPLPVKKHVLPKSIKLDDALDKIKSEKKEKIEQVQKEIQAEQEKIKSQDLSPEEQEKKMNELEELRLKKEAQVRQKADEDRQNLQKENEAIKKQKAQQLKPLSNVKPRVPTKERGKSIILIDEDEEGPPPVKVVPVATQEIKPAQVDDHLEKQRALQKKQQEEAEEAERLKAIEKLRLEEEEIQKELEEEEKRLQQENLRVDQEKTAQLEIQKQLEQDEANRQVEAQQQERQMVEVQHAELKAVEKVQIHAQLEQELENERIHMEQAQLEQERQNAKQQAELEDRMRLAEEEQQKAIQEKHRIESEIAARKASLLKKREEEKLEELRLEKLAEEERQKKELEKLHLEEIARKEAEEMSKQQLQEQERLREQKELEEEKKRIKIEAEARLIEVEKMEKQKQEAEAQKHISKQEAVPIVVAPVIVEDQPAPIVPRSEKERMYLMQKERMKKAEEEKEKKRQAILLKQQEALQKKAELEQEVPVVDETEKLKADAQQREREAILAKKVEEEELEKKRLAQEQTEKDLIQQELAQQEAIALQQEKEQKARAEAQAKELAKKRRAEQEDLLMKQMEEEAAAMLKEAEEKERIRSEEVARMKQLKKQQEEESARQQELIAEQKRQLAQIKETPVIVQVAPEDPIQVVEITPIKEDPVVDLVDVVPIKEEPTVDVVEITPIKEDPTIDVVAPIHVQEIKVEDVVEVAPVQEITIEKVTPVHVEEIKIQDHVETTIKVEEAVHVEDTPIVEIKVDVAPEHTATSQVPETGSEFRRKRIATMIGTMKLSAPPKIHSHPLSQMEKTLALLKEKEAILRSRQETFDKEKYRQHVKSYERKETKPVEIQKHQIKTGWMKFNNQIVFGVLKNENLMIFEKAFESQLGKINLNQTEVTWNSTNVITIKKNQKIIELELEDHLSAVQWACALRNYISSSSKTLIVSNTERGAHRTIFSAVAAANDYDMILVESGVYLEQSLMVDKPLLIYGAGNVGVECKDFSATAPLYLNHLSLKNLNASQYLNAKDCHIDTLTVESHFDVYKSRIFRLNSCGSGYLKDTVVINIKNDGEVVLNLSLIENSGQSTGIQQDI